MKNISVELMKKVSKKEPSKVSKKASTKTDIKTDVGSVADNHPMTKNANYQKPKTLSETVKELEKFLGKPIQLDERFTSDYSSTGKVSEEDIAEFLTNVLSTILKTSTDNLAIPKGAAKFNGDKIEIQLSNGEKFRLLVAKQ